MAFLSHFEHDIFISYARLNDRPPPGEGKGWVTRFHENLEFELSQRFERPGDVVIWRDTQDMDESTVFGEAIPETVNDSGIFLALTSRGYLSQRSYCPKELTWFHQKAASETYGLKVGNKRSRLITVLLQNIPPAEWLPELAGTAGFHFHDAEGTDEVGQPSDPDSPLFRLQLRNLVNALETTMRTLKPLTDLTPREPPPPPRTQQQQQTQAPAKKYFTLFLGHTEGTLKTKTRDRVLEHLWLKNVEVITDIPPPRDAGWHEQKVRDEMQKAGLCVHLLDHMPGQKIQGDEDRTYYQKQIELGAESGKPQFICVPEKLDIQAVKNPAHKTLLDRLENGSREHAAYAFVRKSHPGQIAHEILQQIEKLKEPDAAATHRPAALLDIHEKDEDFALMLSAVLLRRRLQLLINPTGDGPQQDMTLFGEVRKMVKVLIIVLGHVTELWASRRLASALQEAHASLKFCGIYVPLVNGQTAPRPIDYSAFQIPRVKIPVTFFFTPENLNDLLDKYLGNDDGT